MSGADRHSGTSGPADRGRPGLAPDSDTDTLGSRRTHRPVHLHPGYVALVVLGGIAGTLARFGMAHAVPDPAGWPLATLVTNVAGAFLLGVLLELLVASGPDAGRRRAVRLLAGTGFMGAFTTYSTLAVEADLLFAGGRAFDALLYLTLSLLLGFAATAAGIWLSSRFHRSRNTDGPR